MKFIFGMQRNIKVFYNLILSFWGVRGQACPKYPKWETCISLQYLQKNTGDEADFLAADKCESLLQDGSIILGVSTKACPKYIKEKIYNIFAKSQGKREEWSWFFACR